MLIIVINFIFFFMQGSVIYECQRGGCNPWYINYWSIFSLIFFVGYAIIKTIVILEESMKNRLGGFKK